MEINETEKLEYYLSSLSELGGILIDAEKIETVSSGILRLTLGTVMASKGAIFLYKKETNRLSFLTTKGIEKANPFIASVDFKKELKKYNKKHIFLEKNKKTIIIEKKTRGGKLKIALPLFHKNNLLGILCVGPKFMNESYTEVDIKILEIISNHLTKALYNYKLINDVETKTSELNIKLLELETLFDISVAISSVLDIKELGEDVLWRSVGILNASKGLLLLKNEGNPILNPSSNFNWEENIPLVSKKTEIFITIEKTKKGCVLTEKEKNPIQKKFNEKNLIISPIIAKSKNQGYMVLCNKETRKGVEPFNDLDLDLLTALCNQAAVAMENAKLFKEITKEKQFNESILGSIATGVITMDNLGEVDSINSAGVNILKTEKRQIIGNHYMFLFEKDEQILELISKTETENKTTTELNLPFYTVSKETVVNVSVSPRIDPEGNKQGVVVAIEDISDINKVKKTFKRYVSKQVVDELLDNDAKLNLGGEERKVTILFTDIRGFTSMSEKMEPETVVSTLNEYFSDMIDIIFKNNGTLDKIIGDELMVVYGAPIATKNDTERAVKTAIEMQEKIKKLNKQRKKRNLPAIHVGAGINTGTVISGNIGSRDMMDYTVIGDTVNLAARLCSSAKPGEVLVSKLVFKETDKLFKYKKLEPIFVKGKQKAIELFSVKT